MAARGVTFNLSGTVKHMGLPVAATTIVLYDFWSSGSGLVRHKLAEQVTQQPGEFSFDVRQGVYSLDVVPNRETRFARQYIGTIKVASNIVVPVVMKNGSLLAGQVKKSSGEPVSNCQLVFSSTEKEELQVFESTDAQGRFSLALPKSAYRVVFRCPAHSESPGPLSEAFLCTSAISVDVQRDMLGLDLVLPALVAFKGAVADERGHPVADVKVTLRPSQSDGAAQAFQDGCFSVCQSDRIGQFQCLVEPGLYDVKMEPPPESHLAERQVGSILVDQARTRTLSLGCGYKLAGTVTFQSQPVKDCLITVRGGKTESSTLSDPGGHYALALPGGVYDMTAVVQPDSLARLPVSLPAPFHCSVTLTEDTGKHVDLSEGVQLSGRVVDRSQSPRAGVQIALYKHTEEPLDTTSGAQHPVAFGIAGDDGTYEFRLTPDRYWVVVNNQKSTAHLLEPASADVQLDLLWDTGCLVEFEVLSDFDQPIARCHVYCDLYAAAPRTSGETVSAVSGDSGICRFAIAAGIYAFRFEPPGNGPFQSKTIRQLSVSCDIKRRVRLVSKAASSQTHP